MVVLCTAAAAFLAAPRVAQTLCALCAQGQGSLGGFDPGMLNSAGPLRGGSLQSSGSMSSAQHSVGADGVPTLRATSVRISPTCIGSVLEHWFPVEPGPCPSSSGCTARSTVNQSVCQPVRWADLRVYAFAQWLVPQTI